MTKMKMPTKNTGMNTTYTHIHGRTKRTIEKKQWKNERADNLSDISAITDKAAPHVTYLTSNIFTRFDHSSLGNLKPK